jgi:hypothetical protein
MCSLITDRRTGFGAVLLTLTVIGAALGGTLAFAAPARKNTNKTESASTATSGPTAVINRLIRQGWLDNEIKPSETATDGEWCRRIHLDLIGRIPSYRELTAFVDDKSSDKRQALVSKLLSDPYADEYARNWTTLWTNILIGRNGGTERRSLTSRDGMQRYLRKTFLENRPYDRMVGDLISAEGTTKPGHPKFNGATNFLAMKLMDSATQATAKTSQIFLGMQVQCTQCHNHPFNQAKQNQFWEMNAFFRQTVALRRFGGKDGRDIDHVQLTDQDFAGEDRRPEAAAIFYELRNGLTKVAFPRFVDGQEIGRSGYVDQVNRRKELAKLVVKSPNLARTIVNRTWAHFMGYGFTKPIDDMGSHNQPTHPELLDALAKSLRNQEYDLKQLMRWIVMSEPYSLSSRMTKDNATDDPSLGEPPMFSHFYMRQMRAEELYESLLVATRADKTKSSGEQEKTKKAWLKQFVIAFGNDEGAEMTTFNGSIPQALMMMNGDLIKQAVNTKTGSFLQQVAGSKLTPAKKINYLYMAALARKPRQSDVQMANLMLKARDGDTAAAMQDIWWVLLNSNEFILNH